MKLLSSSRYHKEEFYGKSVILADREMVELHSDEIIKGADEDDVALLVVGDPFGSVGWPPLEMQVDSN